MNFTKPLAIHSRQAAADYQLRSGLHRAASLYNLAYGLLDQEAETRAAEEESEVSLIKLNRFGPAVRQEKSPYRGDLFTAAIA